MALSRRNPSGALVVRAGPTGRPYYEAKWRDSGRRQRKRRLGPAWVEQDAAGGWKKRRGRAPDDFLDEKTAIVEMRAAIDAREADLSAARPESEPLFEEAAADWLRHLEHVVGAKPSTLSDYRYSLGPAEGPTRKRGRAKGRRIMAEFGGRKLSSIKTAEVDRFLERLDTAEISKRTINKYRQTICSVLEHAVRHPDRYGLRTNVARASAKRREADPAVLDFYEVEEVAALARAAAEGRHRDPRRPAVSEEERWERQMADEQDAALFTVAAFTGLRMGELLALRWRDVRLADGAMTVSAALSAGQASSTKSRKLRTVPLATPAAAQLAKLADRDRFVSGADLVFCGPLGDHLDSSALRRRYRRAQAAASLRPLRFHDLRHSFGSLVVREVDTGTLKSWMGHAKLTTTERYLHAKPRHGDVARLDRAFAGGAGELDTLDSEPSKR